MNKKAVGGKRKWSEYTGVKSWMGATDFDGWKVRRKRELKK